MTQRALQTITTDLQIELTPGTDQGIVTAAVEKAAPGSMVTGLGYATVDGFEFATGQSVQTTGSGKAVGLPRGYFDRRSNDIRVLSGDLRGAVLIQQTAANLHAGVGDTVTLHRPAMPDARVAVTGIVDLKSADMFFQAIGVPAGSAPTAPPDNAVLMPIDIWQTMFEPQATHRPDTVRTQLHVVIDRNTLPTDPAAAYVAAASLGRNIEARLAGSASLANNLAAQLDAARGDALYAKVLFLFLGAPGALLAAILTMVVARSGRATRAHDRALLRQHGAAASTRLKLLLTEALLTGGLGVVVGLALAVIGGALGDLPLGGVDNLWFAVAVVLGFFLALLALASDDLMQLIGFGMGHGQTASTSLLRRPPPLWQRLYLDLLCLVVAGLVFWQTAATGYQVVLATEGVTATSVDYTAFFAPILLWIGGGLLTLRLTRLGLGAGQAALARLLSSVAGALAKPVAAALAWQRARLALATALVTVATGFLVSTAVFNSTYDAQARVDAELTNGADVTVTGTTASPAGSHLTELSGVSGVVAARAMQHRFAYVGTDLQDLYGIDPKTLGTATDLSNAYFGNGSAATTMAALSAKPDAILVSEETVNDFQLQLGDTLNLRLQGADHAYHVVPFTFAGVAREFPTAPHDSFLVANAAYVASATGLANEEVVLLRTSRNPDEVKASLEQALTGTGLQVSSLPDAVRTIGSNLTAVDLKGLTRIELGFGVVLGLIATGLNLALGFADRQRDFAILRALGAARRKLASFVWGEAAVVVAVGIVAGALLGGGVAAILIVVLQGVFDPPPEMPSIPVGYLLLTGGVLIGASALAVIDTVARADRNALIRMRETR
jgi:putative ABC transport system permease protein